jgi:hypothetical protein
MSINVLTYLLQVSFEQNMQCHLNPVLNHVLYVVFPPTRIFYIASLGLVSSYTQ